MTIEAKDVESLPGKNQQILDMLTNGEFVEGMEPFYGEDAINEESTGVMAQGKQAIIENEKTILQLLIPQALR